MQRGGRRLRWADALLAFFVGLMLGAPGRAFADDGHVEQGGDRFKPNPEVLSPPILQHPIYGCADTVVVMGFVPHAELQIFAAGIPTPIGIQPNAIDLGPGQVVKVSAPFTVGQVISAKQVMGGVTSKPSNTVTVSDFRAVSWWAAAAPDQSCHLLGLRRRGRRYQRHTRLQLDSIGTKPDGRRCLRAEDVGGQRRGSILRLCLAPLQSGPADHSAVPHVHGYQSPLRAPNRAA